MNRSCARRLPRKARSVGSEPLSNSWNVGTTRTPPAWAALVTAAAAGLTYVREERDRRQRREVEAAHRARVQAPVREVAVDLVRHRDWAACP
jgi:hypothetical protein